MKAWRFVKTFGLENLTCVELADPRPGPGQAVVRVRACSLNYRDLVVSKGGYGRAVKPPLIPLSDGAGEVIAIGEGVTHVKSGERVAANFMQGWLDGPPDDAIAATALGGAVDGMLAEQVCLNAEGLVRIPEHLSFEEAAALPCAAVTAWNALRVGEVKPGSTVLIQGTGGVSIFALQLARLKGARVLGISGSDEKLERAYQLGLDAGLNYKENPEWDRWALDETGGLGVDLVIEVGGLGTLPRSLRALRVGGALAQVGVLTGSADPASFPIGTILHKQVRTQGIYVGSRQDFEELNKAITLTQLRPVGENFHWSQAREALARMEEGSHFGKLVLTVG